MPSTDMTILDGGMGRELHRIGAPFRQPEWSALALMEAPRYVQEVHQSYLEAGAHIITANSYAVVPYHIGEERFTAQGHDLAALAGQLGRNAINQSTTFPKARLAGSLPPALGSYRPDLFDAPKAHAILSTLVSALSPHVDLWLAETQSSIAEAQLVRAVIGSEDTRPLWLSFTLDDTDITEILLGHKEPKLRSGETISEAVTAAYDLKACALLFNCSDAHIMLPALSRAQEALSQHPHSHSLQLGAYANAFTPHDHDDGSTDAANEVISTLREDLGPSRYTALATQWRNTGAHIIGGCCGIGPDYIHALAAHFGR